MKKLGLGPSPTHPYVIARPFKKYPNLDFLFENMRFGNPGTDVMII
jgi:hypothetical protein